MIKWSVHQSDKDYGNKSKTIMTTAWLVWWLIFGDKDYIVTINRMKD